MSFQQNPLTWSSADTITLNDPITGTPTAFVVVYVEAVAIGTPQAHKRTYLDRFQPQSWPDSAL